MGVREEPALFCNVLHQRAEKDSLSSAVDVSFREFGIRAYDDHNIAVGRYLIMPDHLHLFVSGPGDFQLGRWVGTLKQFLARRILIGQSVEPFWQRGFFDHVLRNDESYGKKWDYVRTNPVRAGYVGNAEEWPYSGEIVIIDRA